eukprot:7385908-Prymnesium_polylepis.1
MVRRTVVARCELMGGRSWRAGATWRSVARACTHHPGTAAARAPAFASSSSSSRDCCRAAR